MKKTADKQIFTYKDRTIVFKDRNNNVEIELKHDSTIKYLKYNYFTDEYKNLYTLEECNGEIIKRFLTKLTKSIFGIFEYKDVFYIANTVGDLFILRDNTLEFILGISSNFKYIYIDKFIFVLDKYNRIRISDFTGKIISYLFLLSFTEEKIINTEEENCNVEMSYDDLTEIQNYNGGYILVLGNKLYFLDYNIYYSFQYNIKKVQIIENNLKVIGDTKIYLYDLGDHKIALKEIELQ